MKEVGGIPFTRHPRVLNDTERATPCLVPGCTRIARKNIDTICWLHKRQLPNPIKSKLRRAQQARDVDAIKVQIDLAIKYYEQK